jgi:hypothetical protein
MTFKNIEIKFDLDNTTYRQAEGLSYSGLKQLLQIPNKFYKKYIKNEAETPTEAMKLGSALHSLIEGKENDFDVLPSDAKGNIYLEGDGKRKEAFKKFEVSPYFKKEEWEIITSDDKGRETFKFFHRHYKKMEDLQEAEKHKTILSFASVEKYEEMARELKVQSFYKKIQADTVHKEVSFSFDYQDIKIKGRMDGLFVDNEKVIIYDYKTTSGKFEPKDIYRTIKTYGYNLQAYIYIQAMQLRFPNRKISFSILLQSKENPENCCEVIISENNHDNTIEHLYQEAKAMFCKGIEVYKQYMEKGIEQEWFNEAPSVNFNLTPNQILYINNEIMSNNYPIGGNDLLYDIDGGGELNYFVNKR